MSIITAYINHVERSVEGGFRPLTFAQFNALAMKLGA